MLFPELFGVGAFIAILGLRRVVLARLLSGILMVGIGVWICNSQLLGQRGSFLHLMGRCAPPILIALVIALIWVGISSQKGCNSWRCRVLD